MALHSAELDPVCCTAQPLRLLDVPETTLRAGHPRPAESMLGRGMSVDAQELNLKVHLIIDY